MTNILESMMYSYDDCVENAYIISIKGNEISERLSLRCAQSCEGVGQSFSLWQAFDGTDGKHITIPPHLENQSWLKMLKFTSYKMTISEIACALSHISLWVRCIEIDKPIVILEHDAILINSYKKHAFRNSVCWLGNENGLSQYQEGAFPITSPPMPGETKNTIHIDTCQAYAIDPLSANQLFISVLDRGIYAPIDIMMKSNKFCITQTGIYNIGANRESTIDRHNGLFEYYGVDARQ
jgi:hypothetical protein